MDQEQPELKGRALGLVALIIGISILLLSGLCTLAFTADSLDRPSDIPIYFLFGAIGYVPACMLIWAGARIRKIGMNTFSTILLLGVSLVPLLFLIATFAALPIGG